jgi:hypothetical protein
LPSFEVMLEQMAVELLSKGAGIPDPLAGVLRSAYPQQLLTLSLESVHGPLLLIGPKNVSASDNERNVLALPALAGEQNNEKRFFFTMSDKRWEVLSAFTLGNTPFFTTLTLDITKSSSTPIRSGLFKLSDYFTVQCRKLLQLFIETVNRHPGPGSQTTGNFAYEKSVLEKITSFSDQVQCAVLLDEDGFIIHTEGAAGSVDELGGALARLFYRSNHELARLDCTDCTTITLADHEYTIRIGRLAGTSLAIAVSVGGIYATACAHFLHSIGSEALLRHADRTGQLWGVSLADIQKPARKRDSWFGLPWLIPHGKFVGKSGGKSFHAPSCQILAKTDANVLIWFESRAAAIQQGLRPCGACNP